MVLYFSHQNTGHLFGRKYKDRSGIDINTKQRLHFYLPVNALHTSFLVYARASRPASTVSTARLSTAATQVGCISEATTAVVLRIEFEVIELSSVGPPW